MARRRCRLDFTSSLALAGEAVFGIGDVHGHQPHLLRQEPGRRVRVLERLSWPAEVFPGRDGFVLAHARDGRAMLRFYGAAGTVACETALAVGLPGDLVRVLAMNPANGHLVVETRAPAADARGGMTLFTPTPGRLWLLDSDGCQVLASSPAEVQLSHYGACFLAEDRFITLHRSHGLTLWGMTGSALEPLVARPGLRAAAPTATGARIAAQATRAAGEHTVKTHYLDPATLTPVFETTEPTWTATDHLWRSPLPTGPLILASERQVTIVSAAAEAAAVADRPPSSWTPADLAAVASAVGNPDLSPSGRELLPLLHYWLRHQLGEPGD